MPPALTVITPAPGSVPSSKLPFVPTAKTVVTNARDNTNPPKIEINFFNLTHPLPGCEDPFEPIIFRSMNPSSYDTEKLLY